MHIPVILPLAAFLITAALSAAALGYARKRGLYDRPGRRSSHATPTPRGGGIGILVALLLSATALWWLDWLPGEWYAGLGGGLLLVGTVGWLDDHRSLHPRARIVVHALAAAWLVYFAGGVQDLELGARSVPLGPLGHILPFVALVWLTNLYNFMDGIDALAASQGIFAGLVMAGWLWLAGAPGLSLLALCLAAACAGFLPWNLPRARIFLGDVGSTSLGFAFGAIALLGARAEAMPVLVSLVILSVFVFDATFTLLARMVARERWYTAHREHAYQYLVRAGLSHGKAVLGLAAVNLLVILPVVMVLYSFPSLLGGFAAVTVVAAWVSWQGCRRRCAWLETRTGRT